MQYRPEIDGLRAVAVVPVIFFHAGFANFSGGFVGVDIFFVISGYLITSIILSDLSDGRFSLAHFYERRARRILPALYLVMLACLPMAWFWLLPADMQDFSESLIAVATFTSNILFWRESGYWSAASELKPLLHTWSLAIEEQFYVLFPLFLALLWRSGKRWVLSALLLVAALSLAAAQWGAYYEPSASFYLLPTRCWELAIGACCAWVLFYRNRTIAELSAIPIIGQALGLVGLLMIGYAVAEFDEHTPFPSFYALLPTLGTGLVILFGTSRTLVGSVLSTRALVAVGLISYSAYLWHQPLFAFARHYTLTAPGGMVYITLAILVLPLSYISWRYVERPFRSQGQTSRQFIVAFSLVGGLFFVAVGLAGILTGGFEGRGTQQQQLGAHKERLKINRGLSDTCDGVFPVPDECATAANPEILVWGDSHAMHLIDGILSSRPDAKIVQMTKSFCGPFFDVAPLSPPDFPAEWAKGCLAFNNQVRDWLQQHPSVKYAVLSSPFSQYLSESGSLYSRKSGTVPASTHRAKIEFMKTLEELESMGIKPVVFSSPPANGINLGRCLAKTVWRGLPQDACNFARQEIIRSRLDAFDFIDGFAHDHSVVFLPELMCADSVCRTHLDSVYLFRDAEHLSREGSVILGKRYDFYGIITGQ